jgi:tetratricopeptide (TPR) repeat protein
MMTNPRRGLAILLVLVALVGCRPDDQRTDSVDPSAGEQMRSSWSPEVIERVDAGNAAIRADSFDVAKEHFQAVIELEPELAVGWFGLYMAERGLGNEEAAAAALEEAQRIQTGASLIHPENEGGAE